MGKVGQSRAGVLVAELCGDNRGGRSLSVLMVFMVGRCGRKATLN